MGRLVSWFYFFVFINGAWAQNLSRIEFSLEHTNDMDLMGGNDEGFTFGNKSQVDAKFSQSPFSAGPLEFKIGLGNRLFTDKKDALLMTPDNQVYWGYQRDFEGKIFQNFVEEFRLSCEAKLWDREALGPNPEKNENFQIRNFWKVGCDVIYETTAPTPTGTDLQSAFHQWSGLNATNATTRVYNNTFNEIENDRFGMEFVCKRGISLEWGNFVTCEVAGGLTLDTFGVADSSLDGETRLSLHTRPQNAFNRDKPTLGIFSRCSVKQYMDFEERDSEIGVGIESSLPVSSSGKKRFVCELEWIQPLEVNDQIWRTGNDDDTLLRLQMGFSF